MTIADKLASIKESKDAIKQAIEDKGVACGNVLSGYAEKIADIPTTVDGIDMSTGVKFAYSQFTSEQFEALNTYNWDKVTNMKQMFYECDKLTTIPNIDTSNATTAYSMFYGCGRLLEIPQLDTSKVTNMYSMFDNCGLLRAIPSIDTSNVTEISNLFNQCYSLLEVPQLDTSKVTNMQRFCSNCFALTTVPQLDTSNVSLILYSFYKCSKLTNLGGFKNLRTQLDLSASSLLTVESLMNVINNLKDLTGGIAQTLTLGATNLAKLTDEQKAVATNKNWVLA